MNSEDYKKEVRRLDGLIDQCKATIRRIEADEEEAAYAYSSALRFEEDFHGFVNRSRNVNTRLTGTNRAHFLISFLNGMGDVLAGARYIQAKMTLDRLINNIVAKRRELDNEHSRQTEKLKSYQREKNNANRQYEIKKREEQAALGRGC